MIELFPILMFLAVFAALLLGYSVALTLGGVGLLMAFIGAATGFFSLNDLGFLPGRLFGIVTNQTLIAVPLFVFMGITLERTRIAEDLLASLTALMGGRPGGLALSVIIVGALLAASTAIVGATVVTLGLLALPSMMQAGYKPAIATGTIAATGTLGQIIPPSIALVLLGDVISSAYQQAQLNQGIFAPKPVSVSDLFAGAMLPGLMLVVLYVLYIVFKSVTDRDALPATQDNAQQKPGSEKNSNLRLVRSLIAPLGLIIAVLGSILFGLATPTEAAGVGATGALILALAGGNLNFNALADISQSTLKTTAMVFFILLGASIFSLVFRGFGGDEWVQSMFINMPGGKWGALAIVMLVVFLLGFMLDFIEITFVVVPIVAPVLLMLGFDPVWLGIMLAVNLQTSFLTPPFGFALFYLRGVTPDSIPTAEIYRGVLPYIGLQLLLLGLLVAWPELATALPKLLR